MISWQTLITVVLSIGGWIVGFWTSSRQIRKNFELSVKLDRERATRELSDRAAGEMIAALCTMEQAFADFDHWFREKVNSLRQQAARGGVPLQTHIDFNNEFLERWGKTSGAGITEVSVFESRQVILNAFVGFQKDLGGASLRFTTEIQGVVPLFFPETDSGWESLVAESAKFSDICWDVRCYAYDFTVELQNLVHSPLFGYKIPARKPRDPKYKVLTLDGSPAPSADET
jgi:hypothetical protein